MNVHITEEDILKLTEEDILKLAKAYAIQNFANSEWNKKNYWKQIIIQLNHTKIQIVKGE